VTTIADDQHSGALLPGIAARSVRTSRLTSNVLYRSEVAPGPVPVVFVHGNVSSALFWQPLMLSLPDEINAFAIDLRGFGDSETAPVDATRGLSDFSDDVAQVVSALGLVNPHLVGWSMGGGVVMQYAIDRPVGSLTLISPVSPYGFGGTALDGSLLTADGAGTGGGGANPDFVARLEAGDRGADSPTSPRNVYLGAYVKPGFASPFDEIWVTSMLSTKTGAGNYPGDSVTSENWPGFAAGGRGVLNTMAPTHIDLTGIVEIDPKPSILWIHGAEDVIVSDTSLFDLNYLGQLGVVPGWPGADVAPAQPMIGQTRAVFERYAAAGGSYQELTVADCGHSAHLEHPDLVRSALLDQLSET
jgi:pimeloyl-ACP methyl ester carboxylesterase